MTAADGTPRPWREGVLMWTKDALHQLVRSRLQGYQFIVVANREPVIHRFTSDRRIECIRPASGMVSALDPILRACGGVWVGHGSGDADRRTADEHDHVRVPPEDPAYTLRRVWLSKEQENGYYNGLSNAGLWPLCHVSYTRPIFNPDHWQMYREVNELFANAVLEEAGDRPTFVFIQDFHFGLLPRMLRNANANLIVAQFWHIPWPNREAFAPFPWGKELLDGLLGNDLLGFHLRSHCRNFLDTVDSNLEVRSDLEQYEISRGGKSTLVRPFPISIDYDSHQESAESTEVAEQAEVWKRKLGLNGHHHVGIGIDRIDYTKGIPERLRSIDLFLERHPEFLEQLVFVQIGVPSRVHVPAYRTLDDEIDHLVEEINWKYSTDTWKPLHYFKRNHSAVEMMSLHRLADFCLVNSLHDGMNLVAKEFVSSRGDGDGVLILSRFTGAARELTDALLINPFSVEESVEAILQALTMSEGERRRRMQRMRDAVEHNNIYRWAGKIVSALLKFEFAESTSWEMEPAWSH
jgi:alpha,alpha-trehalose-phosphate synthase [UDP-forming]